MRVAVLLGAAVLVAACGAPSAYRLGPAPADFSCNTMGAVDDTLVLKDLAAAEPCCQSFAAMNPIPFEERRPGLVQSPSAIYAISEQSPVFDFAEGRSRFLAFELPASAGGKQIVVHAGISGVTSRCRSPASTVGGFRAVSPKFVFLDEGKKSISGPVKPSMRTSRTYEALQFFTAVPESARIVVIYGDPTTFGQAIGSAESRGTVVPVVGAPGVFVPIGGGAKLFVSTATGTLNIWIEPTAEAAGARPATRPTRP
jgi:hypothetical protein